MAIPRPRLKERLMFMAWTILLSFVVVSIAFSITMRYQDFYLNRIALSNKVLINQLNLADAVYQKIYGIVSLVERGGGDVQFGLNFQNHEMETLLKQVRLSISGEVGLMERSGKHQAMEEELDELAEFNHVERAIRDIFDRCEQIMLLVDKQQFDQARRELRDLLSDEVLGHFKASMKALHDNEYQEVLLAQESADTLSIVVSLYLPLGTIVMFVSGVFIWTLTIRGIEKSVDVLGAAADAYAIGALRHRVPPLKEMELDELGRAFNEMAERLTQNNDQQQGYRVALEKMVTQRTRELKRSNEALAKSDRNRSRLLSDISHELRTPLTVIQGESELALRSNEAEVNAYRKAMNIIRDQALHMGRLVGDLLFIARSREGKVQLKKTVFQLDQLLHDVCTEFRVFSQDRKIRVQESLGCDGVFVQADEGRMRQVFSILIDNALRYSVTGSEISVVTLRQGKNIEILVQDDGIGLSEKDLKEVFTRFYRGDLAKRKVDGSGLGLPVAKAIVSAHMGSIELLNNETRGATARVMLPVYQIETLSV